MEGCEQSRLHDLQLVHLPQPLYDIEIFLQLHPSLVEVVVILGLLLYVLLTLQTEAGEEVLNQLARVIFEFLLIYNSVVKVSYLVNRDCVLHWEFLVLQQVLPKHRFVIWVVHKTITLLLLLFWGLHENSLPRLHFLQLFWKLHHAIL